MITAREVQQTYTFTRFEAEWQRGEWVNREEAARIVGRSGAYLRAATRLKRKPLERFKPAFVPDQRGACFFHMEWLAAHFTDPPGPLTRPKNAFNGQRGDEGLQAYRAGPEAWALWVADHLVR